MWCKISSKGECYQSMTYKLPFDLKQKPVNKYFEGGVIKFSCREGRLYFTIKRITKKSSASIITEEIPSKKILDQLLAMKSIDELWNNRHEKPTIEEVVS